MQFVSVLSNGEAAFPILTGEIVSFVILALNGEAAGEVVFLCDFLVDGVMLILYKTLEIQESR